MSVLLEDPIIEIVYLCKTEFDIIPSIFFYVIVTIPR
jgi:hypothetical protein